MPAPTKRAPQGALRGVAALTGWAHRPITASAGASHDRATSSGRAPKLTAKNSGFSERAFSFVESEKKNKKTGAAPTALHILGVQHARGVDARRDQHVPHRARDADRAGGHPKLGRAHQAGRRHRRRQILHARHAEVRHGGGAAPPPAAAAPAAPAVAAPAAAPAAAKSA